MNMYAGTRIKTKSLRMFTEPKYLQKAAWAWLEQGC